MSGVIPQPFIQMEYKGYQKLRGGAVLPVIRMHDSMIDYDLAVNDNFPVYELDNYRRWLHYSFEPVLCLGGTLNMTIGTVVENPDGINDTFTVVGAFISIPGVLVNGNMQVEGEDYNVSGGQIVFIGDVPCKDAKVRPILLS